MGGPGLDPRNTHARVPEVTRDSEECDYRRGRYKAKTPISKLQLLRQPELSITYRRVGATKQPPEVRTGFEATALKMRRLDMDLSVVLVTPLDALLLLGQVELRVPQGTSRQ